MADLHTAALRYAEAKPFAGSIKNPLRKLDPRLGNYEDCDAHVALQLACEELERTVPRCSYVEWRKIAADTYEFQVEGTEGGFEFWTLKIDHDGAPDGRDKVALLEVSR